MSDRIPAAIQIGGPVPHNIAAQLIEAITTADISLDWGGESFEPITLDDLIAHLDPATKQLHLNDDNARGGIFDTLEIWLRENQVSYDRQTDARFEFDGMAVSYRPTIGEVTHLATQTGEPTVLRFELQRVRDNLRAALVEQSPERVRTALKALENAMGPDVPQLEPLRIAP